MLRLLFLLRKDKTLLPVIYILIFTWFALFLTASRTQDSTESDNKLMSNSKQEEVDVKKLNEANSLYRQGKFQEALKAYSQAGASAPNNTIINYNIGNVLYKTNQMEQAVKQYSKTGDISESIYNAGNAKFRMKALQEALDHYKQALIKNPADKDAKFNYEYVKRLLQNQSSNQNKKNEDKKDQQDNKQNQQKDQKQDKKEKPGDKQKKQPQEQKKIDPKKAEAMLRALQDKEKDLQKKLIKQIQVERKKVEKDW